MNNTKILDKEIGYLISDINIINNKYNFILQKYEDNKWVDIKYHQLEQ